MLFSSLRAASIGSNQRREDHRARHGRGAVGPPYIIPTLYTFSARHRRIRYQDACPLRRSVYSALFIQVTIPTQLNESVYEKCYVALVNVHILDFYYYSLLILPSQPIFFIPPLCTDCRYRRDELHPMIFHDLWGFRASLPSTGIMETRIPSKNCSRRIRFTGTSVYHAYHQESYACLCHR